MNKLKITKQITNRDELSIKKYFNEIDKYTPLTNSEEAACAQGVRSGDLKSFEKLITANLRFVVTIAKQYQNSSIPLPDLINSGNEGLVLAAKKFDETKGFRFISYAVWWIRQSIIKNIQDNSNPIRLVSNKFQLLAKYKKIENLYLQKFGELPSLKFVSNELEIDDESAEEIIALSKRKFTSLDLNVENYDDGSPTKADLLEDFESLSNMQKNINQESLRTDLLSCVSRLSERERYVLTKIFNLDGEGEHSLEEIGKVLGLSKERVRQIKDFSVHKLSNSKYKNILVNYL